MHNTRNRILLLFGLLITSIGIFIWLTYWKPHSPAINTTDERISKSSGHVHHDTKMTIPMESTFKPTPSTCPYRE